MIDSSTLEPLKYYDKVLAPKHRALVEELWERMAKSSRVDIKENKRLVGIWRRYAKKVEALKDKIRRNKIMRNWIIFGIVASSFACWETYGWCSETTREDSGMYILRLYFFAFVSTFALVATIGAYVWYYRNKRLEQEDLQSEIERNEAKAEEVKKVCQKTMTALNVMFEERQAFGLINAIFPEIKIEPYIREDWIRNVFSCYGGDNELGGVSTLGAINGTVCGSPFVIWRKREYDQYDETYWGYKTIYWTKSEAVYDSQLRRYVRKNVQHSETLSASVTAPAPKYLVTTYLTFYNEALPNLNFGRVGEHVEKLDDWELRCFIKEKEKERKKKAEEAVAKGEAYTPLANDKFACLFHAFDRSDEREFRMMFTPLCEKNMTELMLKSPYGDDFSFVKSGKTTTIRADHGMKWNLKVDPADLIDFDYENAKKRFIKEHVDYFKRLYFMLAPCLAVPIYADSKLPRPDAYTPDMPIDCSSYEAEIMANELPQRYAPSDASTLVIRKAQKIEDSGDYNVFRIDQYAFRAERRRKCVMVWGRDGREHPVNVDWIEYVPVRDSEKLYVKKSKMRKNEHNMRVGAHEYSFRNGLVGGDRNPDF